MAVVESEGMAQGHGSKSWAALFADNPIKEKGSELEFISPSVSNGQKIVRFHSNEVVYEEERSKNTLLGCVYGLQPRMERLNAFIQARWRKYGVVNVSRVNSELFSIQFSSEEGCDHVLKDGPFTFDNHLIILKKWHPRMSLNNAMNALLIWIQLPGLPWEFWSVKMFSKIGSVCGKSLYCDKCTGSKMKLGYARILVEMESSGEFIDMIELVDEHRVIFPAESNV